MRPRLTSGPAGSDKGLTGTRAPHCWIEWGTPRQRHPYEAAYVALAECVDGLLSTCDSNLDCCGNQTVTSTRRAKTCQILGI